MAQSLHLLSRLGAYAPTVRSLHASWVPIIGALLLFYAIRYLHRRFEVANSRHLVARKHDCELVRHSPALNTFYNDVVFSGISQYQ